MQRNSRILGLISSHVAQIDVLQCFAQVARNRSWTRPTIFDDDRLSAKQLRHPVLELESGFVPNDLRFDKKRRFLLITGPNMGGKSTHLPACSTIILAQAALSFQQVVPKLDWLIGFSPGSEHRMIFVEVAQLS